MLEKQQNKQWKRKIKGSTALTILFASLLVSVGYIGILLAMGAVERVYIPPPRLSILANYDVVMRMSIPFILPAITIAISAIAWGSSAKSGWGMVWLIALLPIILVWVILTLVLFLTIDWLAPVQGGMF